MRQMTLNDKIAFQIFFSKLREYGVLDEYIKEFMKFHALTSPALIPRTVYSNADKFPTANMLRQVLLKNDRTILDLFQTLCCHFNNYAISFEWKKTGNGYGIWENVAMRLCNEYYMFKIQYNKLSDGRDI